MDFFVQWCYDRLVIIRGVTIPVWLKFIKPCNIFSDNLPPSISCHSLMFLTSSKYNSLSCHCFLLFWETWNADVNWTRERCCPFCTTLFSLVYVALLPRQFTKLWYPYLADSFSSVFLESLYCTFSVLACTTGHTEGIQFIWKSANQGPPRGQETEN